MLGYFYRIKLRTILIISLLVLVIKFYQSRKSDPNLPIILWWTTFINDTTSRYISCKTSKCMITEDRKYLPQTSVILFYGTNFDVHDLPLPKSHKWAVIHEESPKNVALFLHKDTWTIFDYISTFSRNSHFPLTMQHLPNIETLTDTKYYVPVKEKNQFLGEISPVLYIQSDCQTPLERDTYVTELMKYISVDSYGSCLNNRKLPEKLKENPLNNLYSEDFLRFVSRYKFVIAFENSICNDYITEKLWRPLIAGSIPVYLGSPTIKDWLSNNSAIHAGDYKTPKDLAQFLIKVNHDDGLYNEYMKHKLFGLFDNRMLHDFMKKRSEEEHFFQGFECFLCDQISAIPEMISSEVYECPELLSPLTKQKNDSNWWNQFWREGKCQAHLLKQLIDNKTHKIISKEMFESESNRLINENLC